MKGNRIITFYEMNNEEKEKLKNDFFKDCTLKSIDKMEFSSAFKENIDFQEKLSEIVIRLLNQFWNDHYVSEKSIDILDNILDYLCMLEEKCGEVLKKSMEEIFDLNDVHHKITVSEEKDWNMLTKISLSRDNIVGLRKNGTAIVYYPMEFDNTNFGDDIKDILVCNENIYCLKNDGTLISAKDNEFSSWNDIIAISAWENKVFGLKSNGSIVSNCGITLDNWNDVVTIAVGESHLVGLRKNGTVISEGVNCDEKCAIEQWRDIIAISARKDFTVGLKLDGTVVTTSALLQPKIKDWANIVALISEKYGISVLTTDGYLLRTDEFDSEKINISNYSV